MKLRSTFFILILAALVYGCKSGEANTSSAPEGTSAANASDASGPTYPLVGTWTNDNKQMKDSLIEFKNDGTLAIHGIVGEKGTTHDVEGTYKQDGAKLTMHTTAEKYGPGPEADEALKKRIDDLNKKTAAEVAKGADGVLSLKWADKDTFVLTGPNRIQVTFRRKS